MASQEKINAHLAREIERECKLKSTIKKAQSDYVTRQLEARKKIEDLKLLAEIEKDYILD
jgi:CRISPR/Cas system Type II protein with McrA/HNH and RuvC-like nuclease domain